MAALFKKDWFGLLIVVIVSGLAIAVLKPAFLSPFNLYVLMVSISYMLIIALAQMIIIAIGQMNLSVGAIGGLVAISFSGLDGSATSFCSSSCFNWPDNWYAVRIFKWIHNG